MPSSSNSVRSRTRDRNNVLGRPEFMSLNQPMRAGAPAAENRASSRRLSQIKPQTSQSNEEPADTAGVNNNNKDKDKKEPGKMPEEDCMLLNPSFKGIAMNALLAIDISLSKRMGVCAYTSSSWGGCRSMVALLELTGFGITWIIGTIVCLTRSNTLAGQEVLVNLLLGRLNSIPLVAKSCTCAISKPTLLSCSTCLWVSSHGTKIILSVVRPDLFYIIMTFCIITFVINISALLDSFAIVMHLV